MDKHRATLIQRVVSVMPIADCLLDKKIITYEMYNDIDVAATSQGKMRNLYKLLDSQGARAKAEFYEVLKETHHLMLKELS